MHKHDQMSRLHASRPTSPHLHRRPVLPIPFSSPALVTPRIAGWHARRTPAHATETNKSAAMFMDLLAAETRIEQLEKALQEARAAALSDALTGALNRRGFQEAYRRELARSRRKGSQFALALIDLDDFKKLNDTLGHQTGDQALVHLVQELRASLRPSDILCRFGGEEFLVLLPETGRGDAVAAISRFQRRLASKALPGTETVLTFSAGVVVQDPSETLEQSLLRADAATYAAKRAGKGCVVTG